MMIITIWLNLGDFPHYKLLHEDRVDLSQLMHKRIIAELMEVTDKIEELTDFFEF
jgi:hypothetical protein